VSGDLRCPREERERQRIVAEPLRRLSSSEHRLPPARMYFQRTLEEADRFPKPHPGDEAEPLRTPCEQVHVRVEQPPGAPECAVVPRRVVLGKLLGITCLHEHNSSRSQACSGAYARATASLRSSASRE
jgi:hypothetical protein